jgi:hypothetical protein
MEPKRIWPSAIIELLIGEEETIEFMIPAPEFPQTTPIDEG